MGKNSKHVYYHVTEEHRGSSYTYRWIRIWIEKEEKTELDYPPALEIEYQKNNNGSGLLTHYYTERIISILPYGFDISAEGLQDVADIFKRMERELVKLHKKGLKLNVSEGDLFEWRLALLKLIGAKEVIYNKETRKFVVKEK
ncbi:MAG: hypothetical protein QW794_03160 [Thermosphaera sp.]